MLYQLTLELESECYIGAPKEVTAPPYTVRVEPDEDGKVARLILRRPIVDYERYLPQLVARDDGELELRLSEAPYSEDLLGLAQHVEALGGYIFHIGRIRPNQRVEEWIAETDEERDQLSVPRLTSGKREFASSPSEMSAEALLAVVRERETYRELVLPLSLVQQANSEYDSLRYVNAFYNYYFCLEGLYGGGKTKNRQIEEQFRASPVLAGAVEAALAFHRQDPRLLRRLTVLLQERNCAFDVDGAIRLIVRTRGDLHHLSRRSTRQMAHPLNQGRYQAIAFLLQCVCTLLITAIVSAKSPSLGAYVSPRPARRRAAPKSDPAPGG